MKIFRPIDPRGVPLGIVGAALMVAGLPTAGAQQFVQPFYYPPAPQGVYYQLPYPPQQVAPAYPARRQPPRPNQYAPSARYAPLPARPQWRPPQPTPAPAYRRGDDVEQAQLQLNALGFEVGQADGVLGPKTEAALRAFQKSRGLQETNPLGPVTREALKKAAAEHTAGVVNATALGKLMRLEDSGSTVTSPRQADGFSAETPKAEDNDARTTAADGSVGASPTSGAASPVPGRGPLAEAIPAPTSANPFHVR